VTVLGSAGVEAFWNAVIVVDAGSGIEFFVSHAGRDRAWAEWVAAQLRAGGHTVALDAADWAVGDDFVAAMAKALAECKAMVALWSEAYFIEGSFALRELVAADLAQVRIVPLRLEDFTQPPLWRHLLYADLFGVDENAARQVLLAAVAGPPGPARSATFPVPVSSPRLPGTLPRVWNLPPRSRSFIGRDGLLVDLRRSLQRGGRTAVHALHGMGGVGKTQLALEYAYRFAGDYDLAWWINAEQPALIGEQLAGFGMAASVAPPAADSPTAVEAVRAYLRSRDGWLVVFDNVPSAGDVAEWVPQGPGHVIITSRSPAWTGVAAPLSVDVFSRTESVAMLVDLVPRLDDANQLAEQLGDLPLALVQAAGVMTQSGITPATYLQLLASTSEEALAGGTPVGYPASLAASVRLALDRLCAESLAAGQLMRLCAQLGPEPIPLWLFTFRQALPAALAEVAENPLQLGQCISLAGRYGMAQVGPDTLTMHRLTQAVIRDQPPTDPAIDQTAVEAVLVAAQPDDGTNPALWPRWGQLLPHILAVDPATSTNPGLVGLAYSALWHLQARGDYRTALPLADHLRTHWRRRFGDDHEHVMRVADVVGLLYRQIGRYDEALALDQDTYQRRLRVLGEDHPDTLTSAGYLAGGMRRLGRYEEALRLDQDTLDRRRRVLGEDHPASLSSASNLAVDLRRLGRYEEALRLDQDTLDRRRRLLGEDDPDTLTSAANLAGSLHRLGRYEEALRLDQDTRDQRCRVLGDDHPDTLTSAANLAIDLRQLGQYEEALRLDQDTLDRRRRVLGDDHPDTLTSASNLAGSLRRLGQYEDALGLDQDTLDRRRRLLGDDHPDTLTSASNLAGDLHQLGLYLEAMRLDQDTLVRRRQVLGNDHPATLMSAANLAGSLRRLGRYDEATRLDQDTLDRRRRVLGENHPDTLASASNLQRSGRHEEDEPLKEGTGANRPGGPGTRPR
jgi:tetratricopeptide (TPR) repeat protein